MDARRRENRADDRVSAKRDEEAPEGPENGPAQNERGVGSVHEYGTISPVHGDPTLDPVTTPFDVARMAGYGDRAHDALQGVDKLVTGEVDARGELEAESRTEGGPMDLGATESIFGDDAGSGVMSLSLDPGEDPAERDWCRCLRTRVGEGPLGPGGGGW